MYLYTFNHLPVFFNNTWIKKTAKGGGKLARIVVRNEDDYLVPIARLNTIDVHPLVYYSKPWNEFRILANPPAAKFL
jgi:hypothetical protein